jgi:hypothetical protein
VGPEHILQEQGKREGGLRVERGIPGAPRP